MNQTDCSGVFQRIFDVSLPQEHVSSANSPQHPLKRGDTLPADDSGYKSRMGGGGVRSYLVGQKMVR